MQNLFLGQAHLNIVIYVYNIWNCMISCVGTLCKKGKDWACLLLILVVNSPPQENKQYMRVI